MTGIQMTGGCPLGWETVFHLGGMVVFCCAGVGVDVCLVFYVFLIVSCLIKLNKLIVGISLC
jgi:hypothetical protein